MRIGIDARYLSHGLVGGVHSYVAYFIPALVELAREHEVYLYADTKRPLDLRYVPGNVTVRYLPYRGAWSSVYLDLVGMKMAMARDRIDVAHFPANLGFGPEGTPVVITLHDHINVLPLREILRGHRKDPRSVAMMTYLHFLSTASLARAHLLLTVSSTSRMAIARQTSFDVNRIVVVPSGPSPSLRRVDDVSTLASFRRRYGLNHAFVLADALKNPEALIAAWRDLPSQVRHDRRIVFFSRRPNLSRAVDEAVASGIARVLVRLPHEEMPALYSAADAFVFPSLYEGFGLPLIEAMVCGTPVIASDRGAIPEVVGDAALLFDVADPRLLARQLERVLTDPGEAEMLRAWGFARAPRYTWENNARRILASYKLALGLDAPELQAIDPADLDTRSIRR